MSRKRLAGKTIENLPVAHSDENNDSIVRFARVVLSSTREVKVLPITEVQRIQGKETVPFSPANSNDFVKMKYVYAVRGPGGNLKNASIDSLGSKYSFMKILNK